ncbi:MAG: YeeE/YedE family protein [Deltaproteobacteria bacterium]|nr:YeeE/YedE family protein [Deltaproteobacteria bacterium]
MENKTSSEAPFWNPYLAGIVLGLVLLGSFVVMGNGLGGSGAANRVAIGAAHIVAPQAVENNAYMGPMVAPGQHILDDWLVWEVLGVFLGGALAAYSAGRMKLVLLRGPRATVASRLVMAILGGLVMGVAARLARGCTSGQALTGGAALAAGSWVFMFAVFGGGYMVAPLLRRYWK